MSNKPEYSAIGQRSMIGSLNILRDIQRASQLKRKSWSGIGVVVFATLFIFNGSVAGSVFAKTVNEEQLNSAPVISRLFPVVTVAA